jgi:O-antigen/teichoic acid export membrane protein
MIIESVVKLGLAILLVILLAPKGLGVYGALIGTISSVALAFAVSFFHFKGILRSEENSAATTNIYGYTKPVFVTLLAVIAFYSVDVILASWLFSPEIAGSYTIASTLGKTILFGTTAIAKAMFPLSSSKSQEKNQSRNIFLNALGIMLFCIIVALALFYLFPDFLIKLFSSKDLPLASGILFYLGIAFSLISIANLVLLYKLSLGRSKGYNYLILLLIIQIIIMSLAGYIYSSLLAFSLSFVLAAVILLFGSIFFLND